MQGLFPQSPSDPNTQAHLLHLLTQLGVPPNWHNTSQPAPASLNLEQLLAQISRHPELTNNAGLLSQLPGLSGPPVKVSEGSPAQADPGPSTYTQQLYGGGASG